MEILVGEPKIVSEDKNKTVFEISPLFTGYGLTLGNSLRRVLLSSMAGAAAVKIRIEGVPHEFTTVPGVMEDVIDIILNIKRIRFKLSGVDSAKATISVKGEKEIKAGDLNLPTGAEVFNPEQVIATISDKKAKFDIEIDVERGIGYVPVEQMQKEKLSVGEIAIDAIFNPVKKVSYRVENIRVGERTDYNRLFLEIETDGSVSPKEALKKANEILIEQFKTIGESEILEVKTKAAKKELVEGSRAKPGIAGEAVPGELEGSVEEKPKKKRGRPRKVGQ